MFWQQHELDELKDSMVLSKVGKDEAEEEFATVLTPFVAEHGDVFGDASEYTLQLFHQMGSLVLSRSFHVESTTKSDNDDKDDSDDSDDDDDEEEREDVSDVAMVPMADLLNAKSGCDNVSCSSETSFIPIDRSTVRNLYRHVYFMSQQRST